MERSVASTLDRMKLLRRVALAILLGEEKGPYEPNQFNNLSANVAEVLGRKDSAEKPPWVSMGSTYATLSDRDAELLREVLSELQREGVLIEGLDQANPHWPFFRLSNRAAEILAASQSLASVQPVREYRTQVSLDTKEQSMEELPEEIGPPKAFISYSWDSENHKLWVRELASRLRKGGMNVTLDQWEVVPGDRLPHFMERAIRENSYVLIICTPNYKLKSDNRTGGVGYEGDIMTAEVYAESKHRKFIPVLRNGEWTTAIPSWLGGKYGIDLRHDPYSEEQYQDLVSTLHNVRDQAPPVGPAPHRSPPTEPIRDALKKVLPPEDDVDRDFEPVNIEGVLVDEVGEPLNDGTRGSALYAVPFKLSRPPSADWSELFIRTWDHPPKWTTSHRPGIARIQADRIILMQTTIEEVERTHRDTLKLVVETVNKEISASLQKQRAEQQTKAQEREQHRENVRRVADGLRFD